MTDKIGKKYRWLIVILIIYIVLAGIAISVQYKNITNYYYETTGKSAVNMASIAANTINISNEQLNELENITFEELLNNPANQQLQNMFRLSDKDKSVKYAYILRKLPDEQVKYQVAEEDKAFYDYAPGTVLNYVWLLDVIVNENEQVHVNNTKDYYKDKNRYTHVEKDVQAIYKKQSADYLLWADEWGAQIAGFSPIYTTEGDYIGLVGVDIYSNTFYIYRDKILKIIIFILAVPTLLLTIIYIYFHLGYKKRMDVLAYKDQLTGIYNRRYYDIHGVKLLAHSARQKKLFTVLIGDIDNFKNYNDMYGHQDGDFALKKVAEVLNELISPNEGFAARYGGEEFVCILIGENPEVLCKRICQEISDKKMIHNDGSISSITISVGGCVRSNDDNRSLEDMMAQADEALYEAKNAGKNTYRIKNIC